MERTSTQAYSVHYASSVFAPLPWLYLPYYWPYLPEMWIPLTKHVNQAARAVWRTAQKAIIRLRLKKKREVRSFIKAAVSLLHLIGPGYSQYPPSCVHACSWIPVPSFEHLELHLLTRPSQLQMVAWLRPISQEKALNFLAIMQCSSTTSWEHLWPRFVA